MKKTLTLCALLGASAFARADLTDVAAFESTAHLLANFAAHDYKVMRVEQAFGNPKTHWACFVFSAPNKHGDEEMHYVAQRADAREMFEQSDAGFREAWRRNCSSSTSGPAPGALDLKRSANEGVNFARCRALSCDASH